MLAQHEVGSEVASGPRFEEGRCVRTEFGEAIAQLLTFECVERDLRHVAEVSPRAGARLRQDAARRTTTRGGRRSGFARASGGESARTPRRSAKSGGLA